MFIDLIQARIHAICIGAQGRQSVRVLRLDRLSGKCVDVQTTQHRVYRNRPLSKKFREATLRGAAQHYHLPEPVLSMRISQPKKHVGVRSAFAGKYMGHIGVVADNLDRGCDLAHTQGFVVIRQ